MYIKAGDWVETIYGIARVEYVRSMQRGIVLETSIGNFLREEVEISDRQDWFEDAGGYGGPPIGGETPGPGRRKSFDSKDLGQYEKRLRLGLHDDDR